MPKSTESARTKWLMECVSEGTPTAYLGTTEYFYAPPALETDPHTLSVVFGQLAIAETVAIELLRLWVARTQSVPREKVCVVPFSEREGKGPVRHGYQITWYPQDMMMCPGCWYVVAQIRCDHPILRSDGDSARIRASLTEWAWPNCQGKHFRPAQEEVVHLTAQEVFLS